MSWHRRTLDTRMATSRAAGFRQLEIGSDSADPFQANAKPRLWRLPGDGESMADYGLANDGADFVAGRLARSCLSPCEHRDHQSRSAGASL